MQSVCCGLSLIFATTWWFAWVHRVRNWRSNAVISRGDPLGCKRFEVGAINLSRSTYSKTIQNLVWATAYNLDPRECARLKLEN
jgi:hypothetical protein